MPPKSILLIGGHGKVSQLLTPLLLAKSWNVTSVIRSPDQVPTIEALGKGQPGKLDVLVSSVEDVRSESDAKKVLEKVGPEWVIWSAGAGGKGGPDCTYAVDQDAAIAFTKASIHTPSVKKFLTVSYISSRRNKPSWWTDKDWAYGQKVNNEILPHYFKAKVAADEVLTVLSNERVKKEEESGVPAAERFAGISLRPGTLTDEAAGGIKAGRIGSEGKISREAVAQAVVAALEVEGTKGWLDILDGEDAPVEAVRKYVRDGSDAVEGEDLEGQKERVANL
ncbi:NAD(P)-binding protein [Aaosphaeria arxii CBS 175.79]|uniref:NAD(P)-binding protein n=1 Tax=Aaosphaeria arxii CBS 175.79 TaxID=1450172 RepID=A0A6A5XAJ3_9PLEO|nr:NAD(P)-binding protein [Aaosphaeria arxii CBS 175.79]KAF2009998.1 NAD(P)-binding protein [Aaosphaeria arxii CBS 175.79]